MNKATSIVGILACVALVGAEARSSGSHSASHSGSSSRSYSHSSRSTGSSYQSHPRSYSHAASHSSRAYHRSSAAHYYASIRSSKGSHFYSRTSRYAIGVARDSRGRIARSSAARHKFEEETGHPNGWPGHVIDHNIALKRGGADDPSNMQWQTKEEAKAKDRWE
jgi:hypothetical protein